LFGFILSARSRKPFHIQLSKLSLRWQIRSKVSRTTSVVVVQLKEEALGCSGNRKTEEKIVQNRKTAKKFAQNRKPHTGTPSKLIW